MLWRKVAGRLRAEEVPTADPNLVGLVAELLDAGVAQSTGTPRHIPSARRVTAADRQNPLIRPGGDLPRRVQTKAES